MVVTLNPAISSNRAVVPMKKVNSSSTKSNAVSFQGGMGTGSAVVVGGILLTIAGLLSSCKKDPIDPPFKPNDTTVVKPVINKDSIAFDKNLKTYYHDAWGVDTTGMGSATNLDSTVVNIQRNGTSAGNITYKFRPLLSSKDSAVFDATSTTDNVVLRYAYKYNKNDTSLLNLSGYGVDSKTNKSKLLMAKYKISKETSDTLVQKAVYLYNTSAAKISKYTTIQPAVVMQNLDNKKFNTITNLFYIFRK